MSITFKGITIKCGDRHSHLALTAGELQVRRTHFWGQKGNSEIVSTPGFYTVTAMVWLTDPEFTTRPPLNNYREELRGLRGSHGEVIETLPGSSIVSEKWSEATFEGFEETPFAGHDTPGPLLDYARSLQTAITWYTQGILRWTLLRDDREAS